MGELGIGLGIGLEPHRGGIGSSAVQPSDLDNYVIGITADSWQTPTDHTKATAMSGSGNLAPGGSTLTMNSNYPLIHLSTWTGLSYPNSVTTLPMPGGQPWFSNNWNSGKTPQFASMVINVSGDAIPRSNGWSTVFVAWNPQYQVGSSYRGVWQESGWGYNFYDYLHTNPTANFYRIGNSTPGEDTNIVDTIDNLEWGEWFCIGVSYNDDNVSFWYNGVKQTADNGVGAGTTGLTQLNYVTTYDTHYACIHVWNARQTDAQMEAVISTVMSLYEIS